jgi:hypothetical protein
MSLNIKKKSAEEFEEYPSTIDRNMYTIVNMRSSMYRLAVGLLPIMQNHDTGISRDKYKSLDEYYIAEFCGNHQKQKLIRMIAKEEACGIKQEFAEKADIETVTSALKSSIARNNINLTWYPKCVSDRIYNL